MSEQQPKRLNRHEFETEIIAKAWKDEALKQELLNNPKSVYARELQQNVPEDLNISVLEETPNTLYLVIPCKPVNPQVSEELSEDEMETVAGGLLISGSVIADIEFIG